MIERRQWPIWAGVVAGHIGVVAWLTHAMQPPRLPPRDSVMIMELFDTALEPEPAVAPPDEPLPAPVGEPRARAPEPRRRSASSMEAVIEPREDRPADVDAAREFIAPERDPFFRPADPFAHRFGRRGQSALPDAQRPRIAGERPHDAPLPEFRARDHSPKRIAETIASFIGGGPNAPVEVPCGGRVNGGFGTAESFSPAWQKHYGCGDKKERVGYDGTVELPPGTAR